MFPKHRLVGFCGAPGAPALGPLGKGNLAQQIAAIDKAAAPYSTPDRTILPVVEMISTMVHAKPGPDGTYRERLSMDTVRQWHQAARDAKALFLLNIQPGNADFVEEVAHYDDLLAEPDVGLALDPEWAVKKGQRPGRVFGSVTGAKLNECADHVAGIVAEHDLPEKVMLFHQLHKSVVTDEAALLPHPGVVFIKSVDGIGSPADKSALYTKLTEGVPAHIRPGFKLFYEEDTEGGGKLMTPEEVMALQPAPEYVLYE